jgi:hypothetical protein
MLTRDPEMFLKSLSDAFIDHTAEPSIPRRNAHFFSAAKRAVIARLKALDRIILQFASLSKEPLTLERTFEEDQLLYDFFANALSAIESFCFGAYFLGTTLSDSTFEAEPKLRCINPQNTLNRFKNYCANSPFTKALQTCISSQEYRDIAAVRNVLSHRINPGRSIHFTTAPLPSPANSWNLDQWVEGEWSNAGPGVGNPPPKKEISLEPKMLNGFRDWLDQQLELLSKELQSLADFHGLR